MEMDGSNAFYYSKNPHGLPSLFCKGDKPDEQSNQKSKLVLPNLNDVG